MDFTIEEYNEEINLTIIEDGDTLEFSIEEVVEEVNITIEEYNGADGIGLKGDKPDHEWNGTQLRFENPDDTWGEYVDLKGEDGGTTVTKTSDLTNDGADGINPFITAQDIPDVDLSTKLDKPTAPNNVPARVINADGSTSYKGDFQLSEQIEISTNQTAQDSWKGKEIWVTSSCTLTIPAPSALSAAWNIDILVFPSVTLTLAITSGGTWLHTTPATVSDAFFRIARRGSTTNFKTLGL